MKQAVKWSDGDIALAGGVALALGGSYFTWATLKPQKPTTTAEVVTYFGSAAVGACGLGALLYTLGYGE